MLGVLEIWERKGLREVRGFFRSFSEAGVGEMSEPEKVQGLGGK